jgi:hypothetical protein
MPHLIVEDTASHEELEKVYKEAHFRLVPSDCVMIVPSIMS